MIGTHLAAQPLIFTVVSAGGWLAAGLAIGAVHFLSLRWNVRLLTDGRSVFPALALQLGRFAAIAVVLAVIAIAIGALALLVTTVGILLARAIVIRLGARP